MFGWELLFKHAAVIDGFLLWRHTCAVCGYQFLLPSFSNSEFIPCNQRPQQSCVLWRLVLSHTQCPVPTLGFTASSWELVSCACSLLRPSTITALCLTLPLTITCPWTSGPFPTVPTWMSLWEWGWISSYSRFHFRILVPLNTRV